MKTIRKLILAGMVVFLAACGSGKRTDYLCYVENQSAPYTLSLDENAKKFQFTYAADKYMPYGKYKIEDGILTCWTIDGTYRWRFRIQDENTLVFIAEGSTESMPDGFVFKKAEK